MALLLLGILVGPLVADGMPSDGMPADTTRPPPAASSFDAEAGQLFRRYVDPAAYNASQRNWDAVQDTSGILYVANNDGVLTYDGAKWHVLPTANKSAALSLAADNQGRIFVGCDRDFGMLRADAAGERRYVSLRRHVPPKHRSFSDVRRTKVTDKGVYFQTPKRIFRWEPETETMKVWTLDQTTFRYGDAVRGRFFVNAKGRGLMTLDDDSLHLVSGGERFAETDVWGMFPRGEDGMGVVTSEALHLRRGTDFTSLSAEVNAFLQSSWVQKAIALSDGTIAVATIDRGLLLIAPDGTVRRHLHPRDKPVTGLYEDTEGGLWAILDGGLLRYDIGAPFTVFGAEAGLEGSIFEVTRHRGTLYVGTLQGLFRLRAPQDTLGRFERVTGIRKGSRRTPTISVLSVGPDLLAGTVHGLARQAPDGSLEYLFETRYVNYLTRSRLDSSRVYAATGSGVRPLRQTEDEWVVGDQIPELRARVLSLAEADDGTLWAGTSNQGVFRVRGLQSTDSVTVTHFGEKQGLPQGEVWPQRWKGRIVFGTETGMRRFVDAPEPHFPPLTSVEHPPRASGRGLMHLVEDDRGRTWGFRTNHGPGRWTRRDTLWRWTPGRLLRLQDHRVQSLDVERDGETIWFGTEDGRLIRYAPEAGWPRRRTPMRIRYVSATDMDSLLTVESGQAQTLPYDRSGLRIGYGTASLASPDLIEYQYRLAGESDAWSDWTEQTQQTYRTLAPGEYTFDVRARLAYGDTTEAARYAFTVLPPWYRTWWAYGLYLLAAIGVIAGAVRWRTWQLRRRREELETTVEERTREIEAQKEQLAEQAQRLEELDDAKSRFFANVSHEFRTPLTLIRGPVQDLHQNLQRGALDPDTTAEKLSVIDRNAGRLLRLVDQLLGIARMEAGTYRLDARPTDLAAEVERIARTFEPLAEREGLSLSLEADPRLEEQGPVYVDREALEHVVSNLLSNAIKFTPEGGRVTVRVQPTDEGVTITVVDTGPGIPAEQQAAVFDRFQQVDSTSTREQEGVGIGLAFASDLVDLHGGTIELDSTPGQGTEVTVHFISGPTHLADEHIADAQPTDAQETERIEDSDSEVEVPVVPETSTDGAPAAASTSASTDGAAPASQGKRVLVVDDNAEVRRYVRSILEPDFAVIEATDGEEGVAMAREELPDVILADVMMPSVDGHEMTQRLKDDPETEAIPVIMVTARAGTDEEVEGLQVGADDYVTKPFDAEVLQQRVEGVVALQERLRDRLRAELQSEADDQEEAPDPAEPAEIKQEARRIIRDHITDPDFNTAALAEQMAMSRSSLYRAFDEQTDTTPSAFIAEVRMERATELLEEEEGTVTQVAYAVGYERLSSFSRAFREYAGQSPSDVAAEG